jgi:dTMP kinase
MAAGGHGAFIAVEGVDGSGKSGVVRALIAGLQARGADVIGTREPGGTPQGEALRGLLLAGEDAAWDPRAEVQHVARVVLPAVHAGRIVVSDRYAGSTLAYQGAGRGMADGLIRDLHRAVVDDVWPDLTLVLDLDPAVGLARSRKRLSAEQLDEGRFESLDLPFHQRIRAAFLAQAAAAPERHVVLDASGPPDQVQAAALAAVAAFLDR